MSDDLDVGHHLSFKAVEKLFMDLDQSMNKISNNRIPEIALVTLRPPPVGPAIHCFYTTISWLYVKINEVGSVHYRLLIERAKALRIDTSDILITFQKDVHAFRTLFQHNLNLEETDDLAKLWRCEKWMAAILSRTVLPEKRFWPDDEDWAALVCALSSRAAQFAELNLATIESMGKDPFVEDVMVQWIATFSRHIQPHLVDRIAEEAASDLGLSHLNILSIRKANLDKWNSQLRLLSEKADLFRETRRIVESTLLDQAQKYTPINGTDVINVLGIKPGADVRRVIEKSQELYRELPRSREAMLDALKQLMESGHFP